MWERLKKPSSFRSWLTFASATIVSFAIFVRNWLTLERRPLPLWMLASWPWILTVFVVFAALSVLKRNKTDGWFYALVAGIALAGIMRLPLEFVSLIGRLDQAP
jgi:hypothetical protein